MTKFTDIKPETDLAEDELLLRLFGALELEAEEIILNSIWASVKGNENLVGVGVLFEEYG